MGLGDSLTATPAMEGIFSQGVLAGKTGRIVEAASKAGVNPNLFAAVIAHETGRGTSNAIQAYNNPAGIMDPQTKWTKLKKFQSLDDGLLYSAKNLKRRLDQVGGDIEKLANIYAPVGAQNDPRGLNSGWLSGVNKLYSELVPTGTPLVTLGLGNTQQQAPLAGK
jgi:hypothetical protein